MLDIVYDTIRVGMMMSYCPDGSELSGMLVDTLYSCENFESSAVIFNLNSLSLCVDVEAEEVGTDTICAVLCDEFLVCDTTYFIITVLEDVTSPPVANNDAANTSQNTLVIINALGNDELPSNEVTQFFWIPPANGGVGPNNGLSPIFNPDGTIEYIPNADYCGGTDSLLYAVCNSFGCDTALVTILVECQSSALQIYDGFSPNNDGINDFFRINGLENFQGHELTVFNRWGNQVLKTLDYANDWDGKWEGIDLPEGTYYYLLDLGDGDHRSGYVVIHR